MYEIVTETIIDSLKLLPFLFCAFLIIEYTEHALSKKGNNLIQKTGKYGPIIGSILGLFPQCGFSVIATNLYITRIISLGTLIAIYLTTSDEMLPIMIAEHTSINIILPILGIKLLTGIIFGILIDLLIKKKREKTDYHICTHQHCHCENGIIKSSLIHTLKTFSFIFIITFILNIAFYFLGENTVKNFFKTSSILTPFLTALIGLIPNCVSSVLITELYIDNIINLASATSGLLVSSGVALIILFKENKNIKENLKITGLLYAIGVLTGLIIEIII